MSDYEFIAVDRSGNVATISLNRPEALNAISGALAEELTNACKGVAADEEAWVVVLRAEGEKAFCVGADLKERASFTTEDFMANRVKMRAMFEAIRSLPQPAIASVFGFALGGGFELALSCDLIVAAEGTKMGLPEARVGLLPAGGGTQLLPRRAGLAVAKELIFTGRRIDATEAFDCGIASKVVARGQLDGESMTLAQDICKSSPISVRRAKRALDYALGSSIEEGMVFENEMWREVNTSEDRVEGIAAFNEKREPKWSNR